MPVFHYTCDDCGHLSTLQKERRDRKKPANCLQCGSSATRRVQYHPEGAFNGEIRQSASIGGGIYLENSTGVVLEDVLLERNGIGLVANNSDITSRGVTFIANQTAAQVTDSNWDATDTIAL